jgi:hypothetical protein
MRSEVMELLEERILNLRKIAKPNEIKTGMSGSFVRFNLSILSHEVMTEEEFNNGTYDDWLKQRHAEMYEEVNATA